MPDLTSRLIVRLIDGVSGPARTAARSLAALQTAGRATVALGNAKQIATNAKALQRHTQAMATAVSAPMAIIGAIGAKTAFEFEKAGNMLEALGEATAAQRQEFEKIANVLNAKYPQSAAEIIRTGTELLKAGLDWKQMLGAMDFNARDRDPGRHEAIGRCNDHRGGAECLPDAEGNPRAGGALNHDRSRPDFIRCSEDHGFAARHGRNVQICGRRGGGDRKHHR
jgi:hypothetical protein